ncbi:MAG: hypothetical protein HY906_16815 [Deltaproteobacteria bacterium]|nr:hypothetical protein [Deltaproteobacteria bacterium]
MWRSFVLAAACSALVGCIESNHGSRIEMTLVGIPALQAGLTSADADNPKRHYELWATLGQVDEQSGELVPDVAVRLLPDGFTAQSVLGRHRRDPLPTPDADPAEYLSVDPCMIERDTGERIFYKPSELQALQDALGWADDSPEYLDRARVQTRTVALALNSLIALTSYAARPDVPESIDIGTDRASWEANNAERLAKCTAFFAGDDCADEACRRDRKKYFVGNPDAMTDPRNGIFYGMLGEEAETQDPYSHGMLGGIEVSPPYDLKNLIGLFVTAEDDFIDPATGDLVVDPEHRGAVLTSGEARDVMRGLYRVEMRNDRRIIYGTASVYYSLDDDPVQF